ncbi:hypothetical protein [Photobacterium kishitanii]|uniref:Uncharacterized protein n=1 Tax=Photobacterium kishitanii TaxID=318456 RepID=A0A2T3K9X1_9GAMM|nr:hypothetical protein [Photobacterium kishitanii]PSU87155.1 hypothetical protein C9J27_26285 [Photobacterium kishitanii]PSV15221.1 hypothetical protein C0W59_12165 [Photobacterium kishitanii]
MSNLFISSLIALLFSLFSPFVFSSTDTSFTWHGVVPTIKSQIEKPITIKSNNIAKKLNNNTWLIEDISQREKHDNKYGIVKILTINI